MKTVPALQSWMGCALCCALSGCCTLSKSANCSQTCTATAAIGPLPPTYENYTPPSAILTPIPSPPSTDTAPPPADLLPPPPTESKAAPSKIHDFFESANQTSHPGFN